MYVCSSPPLQLQLCILDSSVSVLSFYSAGHILRLLQGTTSCSTLWDACSVSITTQRLRDGLQTKQIRHKQLHESLCTHTHNHINTLKSSQQSYRIILPGTVCRCLYKTQQPYKAGVLSSLWSHLQDGDRPALCLPSWSLASKSVCGHHF